MSKKYDTYIAFDPSFVTMGAAYYEPATNALELFTGDFDSVIDWISNHNLATAVAVVENPALNQNTFGAVQQIKQAAYNWRRSGFKQSAESNLMAIVGSMLKISRDAGENMGAAKYLIRRLKACGIPVIQIAPSKRDKAVRVDRKRVGGKVKSKTHRLPVRGLKMPTKTSQAQFDEIIGYKFGRSTEHARDAATMVYGRSMTWGMMQLKTQR